MDDKGTHHVFSNHSSDQENQTQEISTSSHDSASSAQPIQISPETPPHTSEQPDSSLNDGVEKSQ